MKLEPSGGARLRTNEDTGRPYWSLWGEGWKDGEDMEAGENIVFNPNTFPPGTKVVVYEPGPDSKVAQAFYAKFGVN